MNREHFLRYARLGLLAAGPIVATACADATSIDATEMSEPHEGQDGSELLVEPAAGYSVDIRRTTAGIPHIKAANMASLGFGYGYAFAEDNLCVLEEEILTVRGERAKYFGDAPYDLGNTASRSNVNSDAFYRMVATKEIANKSRAALSPELQSNVRGYAAGVSRYLRELRNGQHQGRHASCRNEPWVRPITDEDLYLRIYKLTVLASSGALIDGIAAAAPPMSPVLALATPSTRSTDTIPSSKDIEKSLGDVAPAFMAVKNGETGSNMYALGRDVTSGGGIQVGNPHFPWYAGERLYQVHLTVPGKMDVQGASLYGMPNVQIGFTSQFAWSHTVSTASRFTPYRLILKPGDPLTYIQDSVEKKITSVVIPVEVKNATGAPTVKNVTLYKSEYGPMLYLAAGFEWSTLQAFTFRDANADNFRFLRQFSRWNMAGSLQEFKSIHAQEVGTPWVNTTATDRSGNVYYADLSVVPNVPNTLANDCKVPGYSDALMAAARLTLLDGSRKACDWKTDADSAQPGTFGPGNLPKSNRTDWAVNCNESYWLTNTKAPITGFATIIGREATEQSLRARLCHEQVLDRVTGTDGLPGKKATVENIKEIVLSSRVFTAERMKAPLLNQVCTRANIVLTKDPIAPTPEPTPVSVYVAGACSALRGWDNKNNIDSRGSIVWDQLWFRLEAMLKSGVATYATAFDAADPINTPRDLTVSTEALEQAFAASVNVVQKAGFSVNAPRSAFSYRAGNGPSERIPVPGGFQRVGAFTIAQLKLKPTEIPTLKPSTGYGPLNYGNSFIQVVGLTPEGINANTFVTYSESTDPASPFYDDYTHRYSSKNWVKAAFTEAEIQADTKSSLHLTQ